MYSENERPSIAFKWKSFFPALVDALNDEPDRKIVFCEWYRAQCADDDTFSLKIIWSNEDTSKLNASLNRHNCSYWAQEDLHLTVEHHFNLLRVTVSCRLSAKGLLGHSFFWMYFSHALDCPMILKVIFDSWNADAWRGIWCGTHS